MSKDLQTDKERRRCSGSGGAPVMTNNAPSTVDAKLNNTCGFLRALSVAVGDDWTGVGVSVFVWFTLRCCCCCCCVSSCL